MLASLGLRARFLSAIRWNLLAAVATQGGTYAVNILLARLLGRPTYGGYAIIQSTLTTAAAFAQLGTGLTATKYVAEFRTLHKERAGRILALCLGVTAVTGIAMTLVVIAGAYPIARRLLSAPQLTTGLTIGGIILLFSTMNGCLTGALAGLESYRVLAFTAMGSAALSAVLASSFASLYGLNGALTGFLCAAFAQWVILTRAVRGELRTHGIRISFDGLTSERTILTRFAIPAAAAGFISLPALWIANAVLVRQSNGLSQLALYSAAFSTRSLILFLPNIVNGVGTSLLNNQRGAGPHSKYRKVFLVNLGASSFLVVIGAAGLALVAGPILSFFGRNFVEAEPILRILLIAGIVEVVATALYQLIQADGRMLFSLFFIVLPRDALIVTLAFILVPLYGARGLACAYTIGWATAVFLIGMAIRQRLGSAAGEATVDSPTALSPQL